MKNFPNILLSIRLLKKFYRGFRPFMYFYINKVSRRNFIYYPMKKVLLATIIALASFCTYAQIQLINNNTTLVGGYTTINPIQAEIGVRNGGVSPINVHVRRTVINAVSGSRNNFCWGINCYPPSVSLSPTPQNILPGTTDNSFKGDYEPRNNPGISIIKYCFFALGENDTACATITFDATTATSIHSEVKKTVAQLSDAYPNPANTYSTFSWSLPHGTTATKFQVFNAIGGLVKEADIHTQEGQLTLHTNEMSEGLYICTLSSGGKKLVSRKLYVRH